MKRAQSELKRKIDLLRKNLPVQTIKTPPLEPPSMGEFKEIEDIKDKTIIDTTVVEKNIEGFVEDEFERSKVRIEVSDIDSVELDRGKIRIEVSDIDSVKLDRGKIEERINKNGIEAIAWYAPFHFYEFDNWGIYYDFMGLLYITEKLFAKYTPQNFSKTFRFIRYHEIFHFLVEMSISSIEVACAQSVFKKIELRLKNDICSLYIPSISARWKIEEKLATTYQFIKENHNKKFYNFLRRLPQPYRNFYKKFDGLEDNFCKLITDCFFSIVKRPAIKLCVYEQNKLLYNLDLIFFNENPYFISPSEVPQKFILPNQVEGIHISKGVFHFPKYMGCRVEVYSNDHPPPHIHVFIPPHIEYGKYSYPGLEPLNGSPQLSKDNIDRLKAYFNRYGEKIKQKLQNVYQNVY